VRQASLAEGATPLGQEERRDLVLGDHSFGGKLNGPR
jgi:hypothetical protein